MKQWIKTHWLSLAIIFSLFYISVSTQRNLNVEKRKNIDLEMSVQNYKLKDGTLVSTTIVKEVTEKEIKEVIKKSSKQTKLLSKKFKEVKELSASHQVAEIDTIKVIFTDTISKIKEGEKIGIGYSFNYRVSPEDLSIYNLKIPDTITRISGVKTKWFLGRETHTIDVIHSNPNIITYGSNSFELKPKKPWYKTNLFFYSVGVITAGYILK
jgi:hypothetical protein